MKLLLQKLKTHNLTLSFGEEIHQQFEENNKSMDSNLYEFNAIWPE
jgi:hypothetical protein